ncbi:hypothetical protein [Herbidospora cretacea]|uniref:hypothetical protein n=1 Tax=Herbidospora cretacea TaxID=28444 RepID=UPI0004C2F901|nr:hypothetical protein [Herbidospora cretacea]
MFDVLGDLNWFAILLGFIALTLLGGAWFAGLFPKAYNRSLGRELGAKAPSSPLFLAGPPLTSLVPTSRDRCSTRRSPAATTSSAA